MLLPPDINAEITLEANRVRVEAARFAGFREAGVNRLSLGIRASTTHHLQAAGRIHSADEAKAAIKIGQQPFRQHQSRFDVALPNQTLDEAVAGCANRAGHSRRSICPAIT